MLLQRKARLQLAQNGNNPNDIAIATYADMVNTLNQDPQNADPANPNNNLAMYREAYLFTIKYYNDIAPDKEKAAEYSTLLKEVNEKLGNN